MAEDTKKRKSPAGKSATHAFPKNLFKPAASPIAPQIPSIIPMGSNANFGVARNPAMLNPAIARPVYGTADQSLDPSINLDTLNPQFDQIYLEPQGVIPTPASSVDSQAILAQALQRRAQQGAADVAMRQQQQLEQGAGGKYGDGTYSPESSVAVADYLNASVPQSQLQGFRKPDAGSIGLVKVVPGIGHVTQVQQANDPGNGTVMTGRYGTGSATFSDKPRTSGGTITENGQKVPIASWFKDAARSQGESNEFFNKNGRKIV